MSWRRRLRAFRRKRLDPVWRGVEWPIVACLWAASLILGYIGFSRHAAAAGEGLGFWSILYRDLQLIVLQSGDVAAPIPWELGAARFLAPAVAGYTAIQAFLAVFREQWRILGLRLIRNHVVVSGLGETGLRLAQNFLDRGFRVVVLEENAENPRVSLAREEGAAVLIGDARDRNLLRRAGVPKAKHLVSVCADDGANAEIAFQARDLVRTRQGAALSAFIHVVDLELCNFLSGAELVAAGPPAFRMEFFNVQERAARLMLDAYPPFGDDVRPADRAPRILIVGLGKMGRSLLVQAARDWWMRRNRDGAKLRVCVIDQAAAAKLEVLRLQYRRLDEACEFDIRPLPKNAPEFERGDFLFDAGGRLDVGAVYICFDDDVHVVVSALTLLRKTRPHDVPIIMRMSRDAGLATLVEDQGGARDFNRLHVFGVLDRTCRLETLLGGRRETIARAIHENYARRRREAGETRADNPSLAAWEDLPPYLRESNLEQADHVETKLAAVGCGLRALTDWAAGSLESLPEEVKQVFDVERLARMEHDRWREERRRRGWIFASGPKDPAGKKTPYLVPWEELPEEIRGYDREAVRGLPSFLARAGFEIFRTT